MKMLLILLLLAAPAMAEPMIIDDFSDDAGNRWRYTSDRVMGGVSDGSAALGSEDGVSFAQLRGTVSTANNGGFIQIRHDLRTPIGEGATGIRLRVRGNGAKYYIHLRPGAARRPWQFYQAGFDTAGDWQTVTLPWSAFVQRGGLADRFAAPDIRSLGIVAYGADYEAKLDIDWIGTSGD